MKKLEEGVWVGRRLGGGDQSGHGSEGGRSAHKMACSLFLLLLSQRNLPPLHALEHLVSRFPILVNQWD